MLLLQCHSLIKVDTSTLSVAEAVGDGSLANPIIKPPLPMPELFVPPVASNCSQKEKFCNVVSRLHNYNKVSNCIHST